MTTIIGVVAIIITIDIGIIIRIILTILTK
jgi:hypothetical protein